MFLRTLVLLEKKYCDSIMKRFEYMFIETNTVTSLTNQNILERLNFLGEQGWQVISIEYNKRFSFSFIISASFHTEKVYTLMREKETIINNLIPNNQ